MPSRRRLSERERRNYLEGTFLNQVERTCYISSCGQYRYWLHHCWNGDKPVLGCCLCNPSKADAKRDDPTVDKITRYAMRWGYGGFVIVNLFAYIATDPRELLEAKDPIGPQNDMNIINQLSQCDGLFVGWGCPGRILQRDRDVLALLAKHKRVPRPYCFSRNHDGSPVHPLYQLDRARLVPYLWYN